MAVFFRRCKCSPWALPKPLFGAVFILFHLGFWGADFALAQTQKAPVMVEAETIEGVPDLEVQASGGVVVKQGDVRLQAQQVHYDAATDRVQAQGQVQISDGQTQLQGPQANVQLGRFVGQMQDPQYDFGGSKGYGEGSQITLKGPEQAEVENATYSSCRKTPGPAWLQDWFLRSDRVDFDQAENQAYAYGSKLYFKGMPIFASPVLAFPLTSQRRSGWLWPTLGYGSRDGVRLIQPYYWNIAPNRDLTLTPELLSERGLKIGAQARYLEPNYHGEVEANILPSDRLRDKQNRWGLDLLHLGTIPVGLAGLNPVLLDLHLRRVSDNNYWRDFDSGPLTKRLLGSHAEFSWKQGAWSAQLNWQDWQVQQDAQAPVVAPFRKWPQFVVGYNAGLGKYFSLGLLSTYTQFRASKESDINKPEANRTVLVAELGNSVESSFGFFSPKIKGQVRHYDLDAWVTNSEGRRSKSLSVFVPTFSVDSGLVFERRDTVLGESVVQTLEPQIKFAYTPFQDQSAVPNFDSALLDFNYAQAFNDNAFSGYDRISDSKFVTTGIASRVLSQNTGRQWAQFALAQRYLLQTQRVTLPGGEPVKKGFSNILLEADINWSPKLATQASMQYNQSIHRVDQSNLGLNYNPSARRVLNVSYLFQRKSSERYAFGWQWPLNDVLGGSNSALEAGGGWYTAGHLNFDKNERRFTDGVFGLEYDGGCWVFRAAVQRQVVGQPKPVNQVLLQLELVDFVQIGKSPFSGIKDYVSGYQDLH